MIGASDSQLDQVASLDEPAAQKHSCDTQRREEKWEECGGGYDAMCDATEICDTLKIVGALRYVILITVTRTKVNVRMKILVQREYNGRKSSENAETRASVSCRSTALNSTMRSCVLVTSITRRKHEMK